METSLRILRSQEDWLPLCPVWDEIVDSQSADILGPDVTCTAGWTKALWEIHLQSKPLEMLVATTEDRVDAILPFYRASKSIHSIPCKALIGTTELYAGRGAFILREPREDLLDDLLAALSRKVKDWDVFVFTLVEDSASQRLLMDLASRNQYRIEIAESNPSPYIAMQGSWENYANSLQSKFRWQLRKFEKRVQSAGQLSYRIFEKGPPLDSFYRSVQEIERQSWKEKARTSITANEIQDRFHARLLQVAGERGWMSGHLLELNGEPIAYQFGLLYNNVFYDLKGSYKDSHRELGPGLMLYRSLIETLFTRKVALFDFQGVCHEFKMRWTDKTYRRSTYVLYNKTLRAHAARAAARLRRLFKRWQHSNGEIEENSDQSKTQELS